MGVTVIDNSGGFQQVGHKLECIADVTGPVLYVTGGVAVLASDCMMSVIEYVSVMNSSDATYRVEARTPTPNKSSVSVKLMWFVVATGAEAGAINLSGSTVRLLVRGY